MNNFDQKMAAKEFAERWKDKGREKSILSDGVRRRCGAADDEGYPDFRPEALDRGAFGKSASEHL